MGIFQDVELRLALGTLRLATEGRPDPLEANNLIQFALNQGVRIIDTADSYCQNENDFHFGEHLVRKAVQQWSGDSSEVRVLTKVGLIRPNGKWIPCGSAEHIRQSVDDSLSALGVEQLFLLQLHARDPQVPFETTLQAIADAKSCGKVQHVGLCNVSLAEIAQAADVIEISCVQNELSVLNTQAAQLGVLQYCDVNDIEFLAHRPLGGHANSNRLSDLAVLNALADRHGATVPEVALAALRMASERLIPLVGATRLSSVSSSIRSFAIALDVSDQMALSMQCSFEPSVAASSATSAVASECDGDSGPLDQPEVVILMGIQGAGKSDLVDQFVAAGYTRLNRDIIGGSLDGLVPLMEQSFAAGVNQVVLDNTYPTQASRLPVVRSANQHGLPVRCIYLNTPFNEACRNVVERMLDRYGMPLGPDEMKFFRKADPNLPPPQALTRWLSSFERPTTIEGFASVVEVPFVRRPNDHTGKGLLLDVDGTLRKTLSGEFYPRSVDDIQILPGRTDVLRQWSDAGWQLFFVSNQSGVASGHVSHDVVQAAMFRTAELLNVPIAEFVYCSHPARPMGCFCRKPYPGLGVYLIQRHKLESCMMVGDRDTDAEFASALGIPYFDENTFFGEHRPQPE